MGSVRGYALGMRESQVVPAEVAQAGVLAAPSQEGGLIHTHRCVRQDSRGPRGLKVRPSPLAALTRFSPRGKQ